MDTAQTFAISRRRILGAAPFAAAAAGTLVAREVGAQSTPPNYVYNVTLYASPQVAFNAAALTGGCVYFPAGIYNLNAPLTYNSPNSLSIVGDGRGVSRLHFATTGGGILCNFTSGATRVQVHDISLYASRAGAGTALQLIWPNEPGSSRDHAFISNVELFPTDELIDFWTVGISLYEAGNSVIESVWINGGAAGNGRNVLSGMWMGGLSSDCMISDVHITGADVGIGVHEFCEGTQVHSSVFTNVNYGIISNFANSPGGLPWLAVTDCHFNSLIRGIQMTNRNQSFIGRNLFYKWQGAANWVGLEIQGAGSQARVHDNTFTAHDAGATAGIVINATYCNVHDNIANFAPCIWLQTGSAKNLVHSNVGMSSTPVLNNGSNVLYNNYSL